MEKESSSSSSDNVASERTIPSHNNVEMQSPEDGIPGPPVPTSHEAKLPKWRLVSLLICLCFGLFLSLLDTTIVATALYTIGVDMKSLEKANWVALAYTLSYLGCAVIFARVADITGRRNAYIAAFLIFFAFSIGCGFAQTVEQLITLRVLQGIGGSGLYSLTFVIIPEITPLTMQAMTGALAGSVVAMSGVLGPVLGGIISNYTTWRWVFWINAPIAIIPMVVFVLAWPTSDMIAPVRLRPWKELDFFGAFLLIVASVLVVFSFQEAGIKVNSWSKAIFIAPLLVGIVCWVLLFCWEVLVARKWEKKVATMFPLRLLKQRVFMGHFITTLLAGFPYFMVIFALPLRMQVVNGRSQLASGIALLPMLGSVAIASTAAGIVNSKKDLIWPTLLTGSLLMVIGCATLSTLDNVVHVEAKTYGFQVFMGLGFGLLVSTVSLGSSLECELRDRTVTQGLIAQARVLGGSIGIAASSAILGVLQQRDIGTLVSSQQLSTLHDSAKDLTPHQLQVVRQAYSDSFSENMKVSAAISAACVVATMLTYRKKPMVIMDRRREQVIEYTKLMMLEGQERAMAGASR